MCAQDSTQDYNLTISITCSEDEKYMTLTHTGNSGDSCHPVIHYIGPQGCPVFSFDQFTQFMMQYNYLWGAILIVLGIFMCFFGNKFINVVLFLVVFISITLVGGSLFFQYALFKVKAEWAKWLSLAGIVLFAALIAFLVVKKRKYGIGLVAAWGGVMLGFVITSLFVMSLPGWAFYLILILCGIAAFFIAIKIEKMVIIVTTSFMGAYALVRGVSLYAGGFPSEISLHEEIQSGVVDFTTFDKKFYIYMGAIVVLTVLGIFFQRKREAANDSDLKGLKRPLNKK